MHDGKFIRIRRWGHLCDGCHHIIIIYTGCLLSLLYAYDDSSKRCVLKEFLNFFKHGYLGCKVAR